MQQNFRSQFENLRVIINTNITTLKSLVTQSTQLSELIETINENGENTELQQQLETLRNSMYKSIEILVDQNQKLFNTYDDLLAKIFGK